MYKIVHKYGLLVSVGLVALFLGISFLVYNGTTYVVEKDNKGNSIYTDIEVLDKEHKAQLEQAKKNQAELEKDRREAMKRSGIKLKERTPEEIRKQEEYEAAVAEKEAEEWEREMAEMEQVGDTSMLLGTGYIFFYLALAVIILLPVGFSVFNMAKHGQWQSVAIFAGSVVVLLILYFIGQGMTEGGLTADQEANGVTESDVLMSGALINGTLILLVLAVLGILYSELSKLFK